MYTAWQEWQRKWIQQTIKQEGNWDSELYQLFQRRYFNQNQSSDFIETLNGGVTAAYEKEEVSTFLAVKLSKKEAKKDALQRAVSRMLKADWVVMADLWIDDNDSLKNLDDDEFGPEGDALWTKLLNGVGLFEDMQEAINAYDQEVGTLKDTLAASIALTELLKYKRENAEDGGEDQVVSDSFQGGDFAIPASDERETISDASDRLRKKYDFLDKAWDNVDGEATDVVQKLEEGQQALADAIAGFKNERDAATFKYNNIFPDEE